MISTSGLHFGKLVLTDDGAGSIRKSFDKRMGFSADEESEIHKAKLKKIIENKTNEINNLSSIYNVISAKKIGDIFPSLITVACRPALKFRCPSCQKYFLLQKLWILLKL